MRQRSISHVCELREHGFSRIRQSDSNRLSVDYFHGLESSSIQGMRDYLPALT